MPFPDCLCWTPFFQDFPSCNFSSWNSSLSVPFLSYSSFWNRLSQDFRSRDSLSLHYSFVVYYSRASVSGVSFPPASFLGVPLVFSYSLIFSVYFFSPYSLLFEVILGFFFSGISLISSSKLFVFGFPFLNCAFQIPRLGCLFPISFLGFAFSRFSFLRFFFSDSSPSWENFSGFAFSSFSSSRLFFWGFSYSGVFFSLYQDSLFWGPVSRDSRFRDSLEDFYLSELFLSGYSLSRDSLSWDFLFRNPLSRYYLSRDSLLS